MVVGLAVRLAAVAGPHRGLGAAPRPPGRRAAARPAVVRRPRVLGRAGGELRPDVLLRQLHVRAHPAAAGRARAGAVPRGRGGAAARRDVHRDVDPRPAARGPARFAVDNARRGAGRARHAGAGRERGALWRPPDRLGSSASHGTDRPRAGHRAAVADQRGARAREAGAGRRGGRDPHHHPAVRRGQRCRDHRGRVLRRPGSGPRPRVVRVGDGARHDVRCRPARGGRGRDPAAAASLGVKPEVLIGPRRNSPDWTILLS